MHVTGRFHPNPRGFGFIDLPEPVEVRGDDRAATVDSVFVPPDVARGWLAGDVVVADVELGDDKRAAATSLRLQSRARQFVVGNARNFAGQVVIDLDARVGAGSVATNDRVADQLRLAEGRQVVATVAADEEGRPVATAVVAGPTPAGAPLAIRARAVVVAYGAAAPGDIPGGPSAVGLDPVEANGFALRATGHLANGAPGLAAGMAADEGPVPGVDLPLEDRRDEVTITIDDDKTRDLDDAISALWSGADDESVHVGLHIADAAGTVGIGSPADRYARAMGTSAYFVAGRNAPMLDPALSEGELSLLPQQHRRVVSVWIDVAPDGSVSTPHIETAWIETTARLSYAAVDGYLFEDNRNHLAAGAHGPHGAAIPVLAEVAATIDAAREASRRLGVERDGRDTLESLFEDATLEAAVIDGKIRAQEADPHPDAQRLVERLMVAANEAVADWAADNDLPLLYRSHLGFDPERLHRVIAAAAAAEVALVPSVEGGEIEASDVLRVVNELREAGRAEAAATLATAATGAVGRAAYDPDPSHHKGLGAVRYTHFTSPIRRYADLVVHRQIRAFLAREPLPYDVDELSRLATWLDARAGAAGYAQAIERNALWAILLDRGAVEWPTEAVVTGLSGNGLKIRLPIPGVGGFISAARALGVSQRERPSLKLDEHQLATADGTYRLGMRLKVRLDRIDDLGRPEFVPA